MSFPTPWTVGLEVFNGDGTDDLGNDVESWAPAVDVQVIAWRASMVESLSGPGGVNYVSRVVSDLDMAIPPTLTVSVRDRFVIPGVGGFEVVAVEDANHGHHEWRPGFELKLKRVTG